jgi:hypothetical protein
MSDNICYFCGKSFVNANTLKVHTNTAKYCLETRGKKVNNYGCEYCDHIFTQKPSLIKHQKTCLGLKDYAIKTKSEEIEVLNKKNELDTKTIKKLRIDNKIKTEELEKRCRQYLEKISDLEDTIETLTSKNKVLESKIVNLEKTITYGEGYVKGCQTVKPPKQITNNHNTVVQKLKDLPVTTIEPLTISLIKSNLENYTYDMYKLAELGVVQFMKGLTILTLDDGTVEKNYVSSDRSRNAFHRLVVGKEWKSDAGARFLNIILDQIIPKVKEHDNKLAEEANKLGIRDITKDILLKMQTNLLPFYRGVTEAKSKNRGTVLMKIRTAIRDINHIDALCIEQ